MGWGVVHTPLGRRGVRLLYWRLSHHLTRISMPFAVPSYKSGGRTTRSSGARMKHERLLLSPSVFVYRGGDLFLPVEGGIHFSGLRFISVRCSSIQGVVVGHDRPLSRGHATSPSSTCKSCTLSHATALSTFVGPSILTACSSASLLTRR